jgi:hypothetical protein
MWRVTVDIDCTIAVATACEVRLSRTESGLSKGPIEPSSPPTSSEAVEGEIEEEEVGGEGGETEGAPV